jgi:hypothetical protein
VVGFVGATAIILGGYALTGVAAAVSLPVAAVVDVASTTHRVPQVSAKLFINEV